MLRGSEPTQKLLDLMVARVGLVWKLDRWGQPRSIQEPVSLGVRFLAVTQNLDTDPISRFLLHFLAASGELEREMIRERVRAGLRAAKANGKALGRPRRTLRRDEAVRLRSQGVNWWQIAQVLDLPMSTVDRRLPFDKSHAPLADRPAERPQIATCNQPFEKQCFPNGSSASLWKGYGIAGKRSS